MSHQRKYILVLILTCGIFGISWFVSDYASQKKIAELQTIQNKISVDILSSETQFSLLEEMSCTDINSSILSTEIANLAAKLNYSEQNVNNQEELLLLKKQYAILQVKDFLLSKRIGERCGTKPVFIFYFYGGTEECKDCEREGYVLDALRQKYPAIRVYSFDSNLDLSTVRALKSIYKIEGALPGLVINGKTLSGFHTVEELEALLPTDMTSPADSTTKAPPAKTTKKSQ